MAITFVCCRTLDRISWPHWKTKVLSSHYAHNVKIFHSGGKVVLPRDLVLVVLLGGLAQVALEAGPGEAGGDTAQERQEGTLLDLLETYATPEAASVEEDEVEEDDFGGEGEGEDQDGEAVDGAEGLDGGPAG